MTDDEALLRAVLAAPADEAPRLVYADWLDERNDSRGEFLRAEVELSRLLPASRGAAVAAAGLRERAAAIDPVWTARVSRPPIGVCCTHIRFEEYGPPVSVADLDAVAERLGFDLGAEYRAFLLNSNGGTPDLRHFRFQERDADDYGQIDRFFSVYPPGQGPPRGDWLDDLELCARILKGAGFPFHVIADYLPIARAGEDSYLLLDGLGSTQGSVWHFSDYTHNSDERNYLRPVALTLGEFLASLANYDPAWAERIRAHDLPGLVGWLDGGGDPNEVYYRAGMTAVELAADEQQWDMVAELLERGADLPGRVRKRIERHGPASLRQLVRDRGRE